MYTLKSTIAEIAGTWEAPKEDTKDTGDTAKEDIKDTGDTVNEGVEAGETQTVPEEGAEE